MYVVDDWVEGNVGNMSFGDCMHIQSLINIIQENNREPLFCGNGEQVIPIYAEDCQLKLQKIYEKEEVTSEYTTPHTPQLDGVIEIRSTVIK